MRIAVVGGGPAGLFFARLVKRWRPEYEVRIFEQNPRDATYGFGVTLAGPARNRLREVDEQMISRLADEMVFNSKQNIVLDQEAILLEYAHEGGAISRLKLLQVLEQLCQDVGLVIEHETRVDDFGRFSQFDMIVGADGANSVVRASRAEAFGVHERVLDNRFAWFGVKKALEPNALVFRHFRGGRFIAHYYAYDRAMSTFVAECDGQTWEHCGLDQMPNDERKALVENVFAHELEGMKLIENKSIWSRFRATNVDRWHAGNAVLIGDALRVAHFSIGSGTRLAMDDSLALFNAVRNCAPDVRAVCEAYQAKRRPTRDLFTEATIKSFEWYENIATAMRKPTPDFAYDFLTRTGRVDDERLMSYAPRFYHDYIERRGVPATNVRSARQ